ncbi:MAG: hypothetical protein DRQ78_08710 [Epsilonproteobacteria bacterium]|nr:MAG: hypothetical protein DRQ78_08710 [Campylobacterota bacterium]
MSNQKVLAMLALQGLMAEADKGDCLDQYKGDGPSLKEFTESLTQKLNGDCLDEFKTKNSPAQDALGALSALAELQEEISSGMDDSFWGEGEKMNIEIDLGSGKVSVTAN